jgi:hypothetical protein
LGDAVLVEPNPLPDDGEGGSNPGEVESAHLRLRVGNGKRRGTAEDVEVLILAIDRAGQTTPSPNLSDFPLTWSNTEPMATVRNIPADHERHLDLCHVLKSHPTGPSRHLTMDVHPSPGDGRHQLVPGQYVIALAVTARNAATRRYTVIVEYDGDWDPDIWDHLKVVQAPQTMTGSIHPERPYEWLNRFLLIR